MNTMLDPGDEVIVMQPALPSLYGGFAATRQRAHTLAKIALAIQSRSEFGPRDRSW